MTIRVPSSISGSTSTSLTMLIWSGDSGLLARDALSSPMDTFWSDFGEVVEDSEREASESAALSGGREDDEEREASETAALSGGRRYDKEGEASKSATLNEGRETRLDFLEVVEEDCVDFPAAESLLDL